MALLVAALGGGGWWLWARSDGGGSGKPQAKPPETGRRNAQLDWVASNPEKGDGSTKAEQWPTWFAGGNVIRARAHDVTAYDVVHGKQQWNVSLPGELCTASRRATHDVAALVYTKNGTDCSNVMAVDLKAGRPKWDSNLPTQDDRTKGYFRPQAVVLGETIKVLSAEDSVTFAAADGKVLAHPKRTVDRDCMEYRNSTNGKAVLAALKCPGGRMFVQRLDAGSGKEEWTWKVPAGLEIRGIPSVDPAVISVGKTVDGDGSTDLISVSGEGRTRARITLTGNGNASDAAFGNDTAYLFTQDKATAGDARANKILAVDLATGEKRWESEAGGQRVSRPVKFLDGKPLVYQAAQNDEGGKLVTLDPRNGAATVVKVLPAESAQEEARAAYLGDVYFENGRFYIAPSLVSSPSYVLMSFS
ncbi:PQQ-binding-like beta-propeller repeat protein [Streptomyces sp. NPDC049555]|uniref:outer membrane protein assembly factor BamB family protein n=1 Tax=Streptomyces sp. NPDC049555 TaxID=3154930 RepID=UPI003416401F